MVLWKENSLAFFINYIIIQLSLWLLYEQRRNKDNKDIEGADIEWKATK